MKVYILFIGDYSDRGAAGAFSSVENAKNFGRGKKGFFYVDRDTGDEVWDIEEFDLDKPSYIGYPS